MRPGDFSPGNAVVRERLDGAVGQIASMRPGDFSPGNSSTAIAPSESRSGRFNEAGGFLPRKHRCTDHCLTNLACFNEAGGFLPRKPR